MLPATPREFEAVSESVVKKVYGRKRQAAFDEWVGQLRALSEIEIFATGDTLLAQLGMELPGHE